MLQENREDRMALRLQRTEPPKTTLVNLPTSRVLPFCSNTEAAWASGKSAGLVFYLNH